jgi:anaerobic selenocysteine-containing dehydrogenase
VLPAATWGERTGTFTNADRTVHLSDQAVEPPGEARSDLEIFLDFARRMDLRDRSDQPLITWHDPESAFEAWKECSRGRPCDYSGLTYATLREGSGIQWPCTDEAPGGVERLYTDGRFNTSPDVCETFGFDLATGTPRSETEYRALDPDGRAFLYGVEYEAGPEPASADFPMLLTTGRTVYQFHTRTKTGRTPQLDQAAPDVWAELSRTDAASLGVEEGDRVRIESARGRLDAPVRISTIRPGVVFVPFHYGTWASPTEELAGADRADDRRHRTANELTRTAWDPVSKQPTFKVAAVRVSKIADGDGPSTAPTTGAAAPLDAAGIEPTVGGDTALVSSFAPSGQPA